MEEKKLTDEEIVKAFENCEDLVACEGCPLRQPGCIVLALDLIHRLQEHNGNQVRMRCDMQRKFDDLQILCTEQKAEIERLTEERDVYLDDCSAVRHKIRQEIEEKFELQKQVDELKARDMSEMRNLFKAETDRLIKKAKQQAVKDTAKEALEAFICKLVNSRLVSTKEDLYVEMLETKDDLLKECYGVEVE